MSDVIDVIIYPVKDVTQATPLYNTLLGTEPEMAAPYYVHYRVGDQQVGLVPIGNPQGMNVPTVFWLVDDIRARLQALVAAGGAIQEDVRNVGGGKLVASVKDADGNVVGLTQLP